MRESVIHMKKICSISLLAVILIAAPLTVHAKSELNQYPVVKVKVNDACSDEACGEGYNVDGTTYVPLRLVLETMGATVIWNQEERSVQIVNEVEAAEKNLLREEYLKEATIIYSDIEKEISGTLLLERQIEIAIELYDQTKEMQWIEQISKGKLIERKKAISDLAKRAILHQEKYEQNNTNVANLTIVIQHCEEILNYLGIAVQSFEKYIESNDSNDYKMYLLHRKLALDTIELAIEQLDKLVNNLNAE